MDKRRLLYVAILPLVLVCFVHAQSSISSLDVQRVNVVKLRSTTLDRGIETSAGIYVGHDEHSAFFATALHPLRQKNGRNDPYDPVATVDLEFLTSPVRISAKVLDQYDPNADLAVVFIPVNNLPSSTAQMALGNATGELPVHIVGHPSAGNWTSWTGMVQNENNVGGDPHCFSTGADSSLSGGYSGGPVLDSHGNLIGMHISATPSYSKNLKSSEIVADLNAWRVPTSNLAGLTPPTVVASNDYWTDPATSLTLARKDNGSDVNWEEAMNYCENLRLAGSSDWRMPNITELQGIYDSLEKIHGVLVRDYLKHSDSEWSGSEGETSEHKWTLDLSTGFKSSRRVSPHSNSGLRVLCVKDAR